MSSHDERRRKPAAVWLSWSLVWVVGVAAESELNAGERAALMFFEKEKKSEGEEEIGRYGIGGGTRAFLNDGKGRLAELEKLE